MFKAGDKLRVLEHVTFVGASPHLKNALVFVTKDTVDYYNCSCNSRNYRLAKETLPHD